jgi:hypothetical protein
MGTIANLTNTTTEFINRITDLDIGITITTSMLTNETTCNCIAGNKIKESELIFIVLYSKTDV